MLYEVITDHRAGNQARDDKTGTQSEKHEHDERDDDDGLDQVAGEIMHSYNFV